MGPLIFGLQVAIIAMAIVFLALTALTILIQFQEAVFKRLEEKKSIEEPEAVRVETAPVVPTPEIKEDNQEELIAVIAAAISACGHQVFVKNIKRIYGNTGAAWSAASRVDNMNLRKISVN